MNLNKFLQNFKFNNLQDFFLHNYKNEKLYILYKRFTYIKEIRKTSF